MLAGMQNRHRSPSPLLTVVVPTFNERDNVPVLVDRLAAALSGVDFEIVFVDDSTDDTADVIRSLHRRMPVRLIHRTPAERTGGLTTAITCGLRAAQGAYLSSIDADLQHPPEKLREMLDAAVHANADVVVGSRYCKGGSAAGLVSRTRRLVSVGSKWLSKLLFYERLKETTDPGSGFFLIRREVIEDVELRPVGYKMLTEILVRGRWRSLAEVPYTFEARNAGQSKAGIRQGIQYLRHTLRLFIEVPHAARAWKFALVGGTGVAVNLGFLWYAAFELAAPPLAGCRGVRPLQLLAEPHVHMARSARQPSASAGKPGRPLPRRLRDGRGDQLRGVQLRRAHGHGDAPRRPRRHRHGHGGEFPRGRQTGVHRAPEQASRAPHTIHHLKGAGGALRSGGPRTGFGAGSAEGRLGGRDAVSLAVPGCRAIW